MDVPQHVLRFWETRFTQIKPLKRGGGRRYYRPEDLLLLRGIHALLYDDGYTIKGVQKVLKDKGVRALVDAVRAGDGTAGSLAARLHESPGDESAPKPVSQPTSQSASGQNEIRAAIEALGEIKTLLDSGRPNS